MRFARLLSACSLVTFAASLVVGDEMSAPPVVESSLRTDAANIRQLAFDGDEKTYFRSNAPVSGADHFTLIFDRPVKIKTLEVLTGRPPEEKKLVEEKKPEEATPAEPAKEPGKPAEEPALEKPESLDRLDHGALEVSEDGTNFVKLAEFAAGVARGTPEKPVKAIRLKPLADHDHALVVREIKLDAEPAVTPFLYPIEFTVDVTDAPEMQEWADKVARICEQAYPMINEELKSEGHKPATQITLTLRKDYRGVAAASGRRIVGSVKFFTDHPDDVGAMVHETAHVVQAYRGRGNPGWLVEGVADYVRFFKFEPGKIGRMNVDRARYDGSYRVTAAFLAFLTEKYDQDIVKKLNESMRTGKYKESLFKEYTGKELEELNTEWRASLKPAT